MRQYLRMSKVMSLLWNYRDTSERMSTDCEDRARRDIVRRWLQPRHNYGVAMHDHTELPGDLLERLGQAVCQGMSGKPVSCANGNDYPDCCCPEMALIAT